MDLHTAQRCRIGESVSVPKEENCTRRGLFLTKEHLVTPLVYITRPERATFHTAPTTIYIFFKNLMCNLTVNQIVLLKGLKNSCDSSPMYLNG